MTRKKQPEPPPPPPPPPPPKRGPGRPRKHPLPPVPPPEEPTPARELPEELPPTGEEFDGDNPDNDPEDAPEAPEPEGEFGPEYGITPPPISGGLTGISERERGQLFEVAPEAGVQVFNLAAYHELKRFFDAIPNKHEYTLAIYTADPDEQDVGRKKKWVGRIPLPSGLLPEAISAKWGGGRYFWQLCYKNHMASVGDLPLRLKGMPLVGEFTVAGPSKIPATAGPQGPADILARIAEVRQEAATGSNQMMELLKEQLREARKEQGSGAQAMVSLFTVLLTGMQQQNQLAQQLAQQQTTFMLNMMQTQDARHREAGSQQEKSLQWAVDLALKLSGQGPGEPPTWWGAVLSNLDKFKDVLHELRPMLNAPSATAPTPRSPPAPARPAQLPMQPRPPAPERAPALPPPPSPAPVALPTFQGFTAADGPYIEELTRAVWAGYQMSVPAIDTAKVLANLGNEEQFDRLLEVDSVQVQEFIRALYKEAQGGQEPAPELLAYVAAVHKELTAEEETPAVLPGIVQPAPVAVPVRPPEPPAPAVVLQPCNPTSVELHKSAESVAPAAPAAPAQA